MTVSREDILQEVRRTTEANDGKPLGRQAFSTATGIREHEWRGRFWARWNDVLKDAGFGPNVRNEATPELVMLDKYAELALELKRLPVYSEMRLRKRADPSFPNEKAYARFGTKYQLLARLKDHCASEARFSTLLPLISAALEDVPGENRNAQQAEGIDGFVYMVKMGKHYKIGRTFSIPRRHRELNLELPEKLKPIHVIRTDDPTGIETYWHKRFEAKRTNSEWFALSLDDVRAFKKRRFM